MPPTNWKHAALTAIAIGAGAVFAAGLGVYSFRQAARLHSTAEAVTSAADPPPSPRWQAAVDRGRQAARAAIVHQNLPGLSVAVGIRGDLVWAEGFGWADLEKRTPVSPRTRFRIGHVSKALTSAAAGLLVEKGQLRLNDEIQTYVPAFPRKQWPVTLRQLMGHAAGIRHYSGDRESRPTGHCERAAESLASFADDPLLFEPDTRSSYSTFGWILVSAAVEAAAREPFFAFMRRQIFEPLGMVDTAPDAPAGMPNLASFYYPRVGIDPVAGAEVAVPADFSCFAGAAGFVSTPSDLVRLGLALGSGTLLKGATITRLQTAQQLPTGDDTEYGLGWMIETRTIGGAPLRIVGHTSRTLLGGTTAFLTFPDHGLVVAATTNISLANTKLIAVHVAEAFLEQATRQ